MSRREQLTEWVTQSLREPLVRVRKTLTAARESSTAVGLVQRAEQRGATIVRGSWLYRWLTAEPEPTVVTIDLRETYTVGPILKLLERVITPIAARWEQSRLNEVTTAVSERGQRFAESSRLVGLLAWLFVPPEPPEDRDRNEDTRDDA